MLIFPAFIQLVLYILCLVYNPKKSYYEVSHFNEVLNHSYSYYQFYYSFSDYLEWLEEELNNTKKINQAILGFLIILLLMTVIIFASGIYFKCENNYAREWNKNLVVVLLTFNYIFIFIVWAMSLAIIDKINKLRKKEEVGFTNKARSCIIKVIIILSVDLIFGIAQLVLGCFAVKDLHTSYSTYTGTRNINYVTTTNYNSRQNNNYNSNTGRTNVVIVQQRQAFVRLRNVLSDEVYSQIRRLIEEGEKKLLALIDFYEQMKFDGITSGDQIIEEITKILIFLTAVQKGLGDEIPNICLEYFTENNDNDACCLLIQYLFPLIILAIKVKIEKGIYKKSTIVVKQQILILTHLERRIESDENGNLRQAFRFRQQVSQSSIANLLG